MPKYRVLVSEITNFGDLRCVAGWDLDRGKMIRPEPHPRGFWPSPTIVSNGAFDLRRIVRFDAAKPVPATQYPHLTEDRVVAGNLAVEDEMDKAEYLEVLRAAAFGSLAELFEDNLIIDGSKAYVPTGAQCRSLGGLEIPAEGAVLQPYLPSCWTGVERSRRQR